MTQQHDCNGKPLYPGDTVISTVAGDKTCEDCRHMRPGTALTYEGPWRYEQDGLPGRALAAYIVTKGYDPADFAQLSHSSVSHEILCRCALLMKISPDADQRNVSRTTDKPRAEGVT